MCLDLAFSKRGLHWEPLFPFFIDPNKARMPEDASLQKKRKKRKALCMLEVRRSSDRVYKACTKGIFKKTCVSGEYNSKN